MSTDREVLVELLAAVLDHLDPSRTDTAVPYLTLRRVAEEAREHVHASPGHDCSDEVERASRAAYAAGQARAAWAAP